MGPLFTALGQDPMARKHWRGGLPDRKLFEGFRTTLWELKSHMVGVQRERKMQQGKAQQARPLSSFSLADQPSGLSTHCPTTRLS